MNRFFNIIAGKDGALILLYGTIGEFEDLKAGDVAREIFEAEQLHSKIDVRINSNGGDVDAGIAIFNALRNSKADITIYIDGVAASIASVIASCGKPVYMSKYARWMIHEVTGGVWGNKEKIQSTLSEIESIENILCDIYSRRTGLSVEEIKSTYFDGKDHWLTADEALRLGFIDGVYDADPIPYDNPTPDQIYTTFNNRLQSHKNDNMNIDEIRKRPRFKDCATDEAVLQVIGQLESEAAKVPTLTAELTTANGRIQTFEAKAKEDDAASKTKLLDDAENDGRINATTRPTYQALLDSDRVNGETALKNLTPKKLAMNDVRVNPSGESPWNKRMSEIKNKNQK